MTLCILCGQETMYSLTASFIFSFKPIPKTTKCEKCTNLLIYLEKQVICPTCHRMQESHDLCEDCARWKKMYPTYPFSHQALYAYNDPMKEWLEQYKFKGDIRLASVFVEEMRENLRPYIKNNFSLVPIPLNEKGMEERGFNQVEEMLVAARLPYFSCLSKTSQIKRQSQKNRKERMESQQPFYLEDDQYEWVKDKKFLLIDDVYTTGRTLFHAADLLIKNGAKEIKSFSVAR